MTSLPIVERELRAAARRPATYRTRTALALAAMVLGLVGFFVCLADSTLKFGTVFFMILSSGMMGYCLAAGRQFTADCLSEEKREGTLGLLFLTDLKGYDVVLGKLAATSINAFYGLLAVMPVLALPLLTGGITSGEFWRVALALINAFLLSLAVGIFVSSLVRDFRAAMAGNFYLLLLLIGALPAVMGMMAFFNRATAFIPQLFYSCPVYSLVTAFEAIYKTEHVNFWRSMGVIHGLTWLLVGLACWLAPRSWQETGAMRRSETAGKIANVKDMRFRKRLLDANAYFWRAGKPRLKAVYVWDFMGAVLLWMITLIISVGKVDEIVALVVALVVNGTLKMWITMEAGQALAEDQKSGAFELLLSTPLSERDIIRGQFMALRRQFLRPLLAAMGLELYFLVSLLTHPPYGPYVLWFWMAGILMLAADAVTLSVAGMAAALRAKSHTHAIVQTVRRVIVMPWLLFGLVAAPAWIWSNLVSSWGWWHEWRFHLAAWFAIGIIIDAYWTRRAWRELTVHFREAALRRFAPQVEQTGWWSKLREKARAGKSRKVGRKWKLALGAAVLLAAVVLFAAYREWGAAPKPVEVTLGRNDGKFRVVAASRRGAYFILPDGSLWRWGQTGKMPIASAPEPVGTNTDWADLATYIDQRLGLKRDGTLWSWRNDETAHEVDSSRDWATVLLSRTMAAGIKRDGTLWGWNSRQVGELINGSSPDHAKPAQIGRAHDWIMVESSAGIPVALRTNGSVCLIQESPTGRLGLREVIPEAGSEWTGLVRIYGREVLLQSDKGLLWRIFSVAPGSALVGTNSLPAEPAKTQMPMLLPWVAIYSVQTNGTLWQMQMNRTFRGDLTIDAPEQVDTTTNWVWVVQPENSAAFGLTSDGTLWTWGEDLGRDPTPTVKEKLEEITARASGAMSGGNRNGLANPWWSPGQNTTVQEPLRPLLKLKRDTK